MTEDTFYYWRRKLGLDKPPDQSLLRVSPVTKKLRPLFFSLFDRFLDRYAPIEVAGLENIPAQMPFIIAPNHVSVLDYPVLVCRLDPEIRDKLYVFSTRIFYDIIFARIFMKWVANAIRIDNIGDFFDSLRAGVSILKLGRGLVIYPEGTRSRNGQLLAFRIGLGVLSIECNAPIIPAAVAGLDHVLPRGRLIPRRGRIKVAFGKPIYPEEYKKNNNEEHAYYTYKNITEETYNRINKLQEDLSK